MWDCERQPLDGGRSQLVIVRRDRTRISYEDVLNLWTDDDTFRSFYIEVLAHSPFKAFRWETPPVTASTIVRDFEFVVLDAPGLDRSPEPEPFANRFRSADGAGSVVAFPNLGNDAVLVVPCPIGLPSAYGHLAAFTRLAPDAQQHDLWRTVGHAMAARISDRPVWLSTAGMGVSWLHVRLDARPKYYGFRPYAEAA
jgi:hypothetical protein